MSKLTILAVLSLSAVSFAQSKILITGSTTVKPLMERIVPAFQKDHPTLNLSVAGGGSSAGVKAAASGDAQIGMASRDLKEAERTANPNLEAVRIAIDGIAVVVNTSNNIRNLTTEQLQKVFNGEITNWKDVGGADQAIEIFSLHRSHGTYEAFLEHLKIKKPAIAYRIALDVPAVLAAVHKNPNAIGFVALPRAEAAQKKGDVQVLRVDNIEPSRTTVANGTYAISRNLNLLTNGKPSGTVAELTQFCLSPAIQSLVAEMDYIPVGSVAAAPGK